MPDRLLQSRSFLKMLLKIDKEFARKTRSNGCQECGGPLHASNYARKPRGSSAEATPLANEQNLCFSFCCGWDGCRKRHRAPSVRFLDRRRYSAAAVLLITTLLHGLTGRRAARLRELLFGVTWATVSRWRRWWQEEFAESCAFQVIRGRLRTPVRNEDLPRALLMKRRGNLESRMVRTLRLLARAAAKSGFARAFAGPQDASM